jgi:hypothetical protein
MKRNAIRSVQASQRASLRRLKAWGKHIASTPPHWVITVAIGILALALVAGSTIVNIGHIEIRW